MAIEHQQVLDVEAPPERIWAVMMDVERWPEWTESMRRIERLEGGPMKLGSRARIALKGAPASVWRVTEYTEGRSFTWESSALGVRSGASHVIERQDGGSRVTLSVRMSGPMAVVMSPLLRSAARRNVAMEAEGLKRAVES